MSTATTTITHEGAAPGERPSANGLFTATTFWRIAILAALFVFLNFQSLQRLVLKWYSDPNWSHGFLIPLFSIYFVLIHRDRVAAAMAKSKPSWIGLIALIGAIGAVFFSFYHQSDFLREISMLAVLVSVVLFLGGWAVLKACWLPLAFLMFAIPIPYMLPLPIFGDYQGFLGALQKAAAVAGVNVLKLFGVDAYNRGVLVSMEFMRNGELIEHTLNVEEACSGIRSLIAFFAIAVAMAYLSDRPNWQRVVMALSAIPIAIFCNMLRVGGTGLIYRFGKPEWATGFLHKFEGMAMLIPAMLLLVGLGYFLNQLFIEEVPEELELPKNE